MNGHKFCMSWNLEQHTSKGIRRKIPFSPLIYDSQSLLDKKEQEQNFFNFSLSINLIR
ncbi:hypothetical protein Bca4012_071486 [Brassica carinata]|uniref:Uncharacterized protein n=2 Tax=Brassica oleracea TaxID=3712 RepID=A0A0D3CCS0_BRAOL|nr:unnamed protein product [Brassica oleracea]